MFGKAALAASLGCMTVMVVAWAGCSGDNTGRLPSLKKRFRLPGPLSVSPPVLCQTTGWSPGVADSAVWRQVSLHRSTMPILSIR
jgi:hypothetical protein